MYDVWLNDISEDSDFSLNALLSSFRICYDLRLLVTRWLQVASGSLLWSSPREKKNSFQNMKHKFFILVYLS